MGYITYRSTGCFKFVNTVGLDDFLGLCDQNVYTGLNLCLT